jgi:DNA repair exonuclease SbcCD ATPase subunit
MAAIISIKTVHTEYHTWMKELIFFKQETGYFEQQLKNVQNVSDDAQILLEKLAENKQLIDELKQELKTSEKRLIAFVYEVSGMGLESIKMDNHVKLREEMNKFKQKHKELKQHFRKIASGAIQAYQY